MDPRRPGEHSAETSRFAVRLQPIRATGGCGCTPETRRSRRWQTAPDGPDIVWEVRARSSASVDLADRAVAPGHGERRPRLQVRTRRPVVPQLFGATAQVLDQRFPVVLVQHAGRAAVDELVHDRPRSARWRARPSEGRSGFPRPVRGCAGEPHPCPNRLCHITPGCQDPVHDTPVMRRTHRSRTLGVDHPRRSRPHWRPTRSHSDEPGGA